MHHVKMSTCKESIFSFINFHLIWFMNLYLDLSMNKYAIEKKGLIIKLMTDTKSPDKTVYP